MIGRSRSFLNALDLIAKFARYNVPVLISGETGTGKELAARAIHYQGPRRDHPFVPVNCGAIPESLIEGELFGHDRGAYTDAHARRRGLISYAHGGTLFLDEIDALSHRGQVSLLRFLQDRQYRPLGSSREERADVRVVAATNVNLGALVAEGRLRTDLLYRLRVLELEIPPLRERPGDPELLAGHFIVRFAAQFSEPQRALDRDTAAWFDRYDWPGNVRELENLICRGFLMAEDGVIRLPAPVQTRAPAAHEEDFLGLEFARGKAMAVEQFEKRYLIAVLERAQGNVTLAAAFARKERRAFGKLIKKHGIERGRYLR